MAQYAGSREKAVLHRANYEALTFATSLSRWHHCSVVRVESTHGHGSRSPHRRALLPPGSTQAFCRYTDVSPRLTLRHTELGLLLYRRRIHCAWRTQLRGAHRASGLGLRWHRLLVLFSFCLRCSGATCRRRGARRGVKGGGWRRASDRLDAFLTRVLDPLLALAAAAQSTKGGGQGHGALLRLRYRPLYLHPGNQSATPRLRKRGSGNRLHLSW